MIRYTLSFEAYTAHLVDVEITFTAQVQQQLWLPTWIPGSYLIREFSRFIERVSACDAAQNAIGVTKINKHTWQLDNQAATPVTIRYRVYAYDLSVRGSYVDRTRLYLNFATLCLAVQEQEHLPLTLALVRPEAFKALPCATTLPQHVLDEDELGYPTTKDWFETQSYSHLIDNPLEIAAQTTCHFNAADIQHNIAISGHHHTDMARLSKDLQAICQTQIQLFGSAPFKHYLFMVMATGNLYGGLEHQSCTSLITPRGDLPRQEEPEQPQKAYRQFLGLCSHEYFHAWLVKFIRPAVFDTPDLGQEAYTNLLWVFEGITSYYDDWILLRSGVINQAAYLELLTEQINRYIQNAGKQLQSVSESSFDAWIKFYRQDENSPNATTSYYNTGALLALCLDLTLRLKGSSLDALLQRLYQAAQQGNTVQEHTLQDVCLSLTGDLLDGFWQSYVYGVEALPLTSLFASFGIAMTLDDKKWSFGLKGVENPQGVLIQTVLRDSAAARAGLSANDVVIAIDGVKASAALITQYANQTAVSPVQMHVFRRDELLVLWLDAQQSAMPNVSLKVVDAAPLAQWLT